MTLIGTPRDPPSRADAEAFLERFVASLDARLPWFEAEVASRGGPPADGSVESLDALAGFVAAHMEEDRPAEAPEWFTDAHRRRGWTAYGAALADGLIAYLARLYAARTGATWVLDVDRRSAFFHQPVMSVRFVGPPWRQVHAAINKAQDDPGGGGRLTAIAETSLASAQEPFAGGRGAGGGAGDGVRLEVSVDPIGSGKWNLEAMIGEEAEDVLGTERFLGLVHRFQALDGVEDAVHEDREVFLFRTGRRTDPAELERRLQAVVDEVVAEAAREMQR